LAAAFDVPLWWDGGTLADISVAGHAYGQHAMRVPFVCSQKPDRREPQTLRPAPARRLRANPAMRCARSPFTGRHTFISHALAGGRTLAEVRVAAGHSSLLTTSAYLHIAVDDEAQIGSLFAAQRR
jgi:integrase